MLKAYKYKVKSSGTIFALEKLCVRIFDVSLFSNASIDTSMYDCIGFTILFVDEEENAENIRDNKVFWVSNCSSGSKAWWSRGK